MNNLAVDEFFPPERCEFLECGEDDPSVPDNCGCDHHHDRDCDCDCDCDRNGDRDCRRR